VTRRRYADDDKAVALAALDANGGNARRTARQLGIPRKTLSGWAAGRGAGPAVDKLRPQKRAELAGRLEAVALRLLDAAPSLIAAAPLRGLAVALGIVLDKLTALRGPGC
jgi:transposase-like protein